ncbi:two-component sensor histidine kinase [Halovenus sp. WSH3]|uniref:histidine kinase n=1 Tax=Halovenus carboxidivorans TaxID=2692199 RepID=A0A6B0T523_9EURY|nr:ATP-binding protein [Halovenus carboxidivorans]MXR50643.1 two-component sensor histidine kinase [Halovenus carboxidivorans]
MSLDKRRYAVLLAGLGALLAVFPLLDVYADWAEQGEPLWLTLAENSLPLLLTAVLVAGSVWLYYNREEIYLAMILRWGVVGLIGILLIFAWVLGLQSFQEQFKPVVLGTHTAIGGAIAGGTIGYAMARNRESREQIEAERDRWSALFENDPNGVVDLAFESGEPVIAAANERFVDLFDAADPSGRSLLSVVDHGSSEADRITDSIRRGERYSTELTVTTGEQRLYLTTQIVPYGEDSEPTAFAIYSDITDLRETQEQLQRQMDQLEASNERLQQFAYIASHDLQEPLRMVSSYMSLLESEYRDELDEEAKEYIDFAANGATRMQDMIDALLEYSRVRTEGEEFTETDATAVLEETIQSLELQIDEAGATVAYDDLPTVEADRSQLGQLFQNLIANAIDHGDGPTITVESERRDGSVVFSVADDGPGIPESQQETIFELFKQGDRESDGTGMGLAICDRIVSRHGGEIWVESEDGEGATFYFSIPQDRA